MGFLRGVSGLVLAGALFACPADGAGLRGFGRQAAPAAANPANTDAVSAAAAGVSITSADFGGLADAALAAMRAKAAGMNVDGVAVISYFEGDAIASWTSKMVVVGKLKKEPKGTEKGSNLLAIAYAKASEMADTLKNSGSQVRPPMTGEFGWEGGVIVRMKTGYLIAAFSGGQSSDDVAISRTGIAEVVGRVKAAR